jgi:hypothetical protein
MPVGTKVLPKTTAFWDTAMYNFVEIDRRFRGAYCLHRQSVICQKADISILTAMRTWSHTKNCSLLHIFRIGYWSNYHPLQQGFSTGVPRNPRVPRDVARGSARDRDWKKIKHLFLNLLAKINRSTEKYHFLFKRELTVIIGLLYVQVTDHANLPWAVDIIIFMQGFPEIWKLF